MADGPIQRKFTEALDRLIEQVKADRSILAAVLCGSLSHDTVWARSDIDLMLVTVDDKRVPAGDLSINADGINVHAWLVPRTDFRKTVEGSLRNSFAHALLSKGRLLYTHDDTIADLCARLQGIGERDRQIASLGAASGAVSTLYKAHKWFITRGDLDYTALWILYTATSLAQIEVIGAGQLADREVIPQAMKLNPEFFATVYTDLLNAKKTKGAVQKALHAIEGYLTDRVRCTLWFADRVSPRRTRCAVVQRDRALLQEQLRRLRCDDGVRISCGSRGDRQSGDAGAPHEKEQRRGAGARVRLSRPSAPFHSE